MLALIVHTAYMNTYFQYIVKAYKQVRGLFPSALPVGMAEFTAWVDDISSTYQMPTDNRDSIMFTLATIIMHLGPTVAFKSKYWFVLSIRASAAKQIAGGAFYDLKERQKAEQAKKQIEATTSAATPQAAASSGPQE